MITTPQTSTDSLVLFRNSQNEPGRGTLVRLSRNMAVFEVYNPYSIVQLSEVLGDLQIRRGDRVIYRGRAVVSNLMTTGLVLIVSVTLVDPWSELLQLAPGPALREEVAGFVTEWEERVTALRRPYQLVVGTMANFCQELSRWLAHYEAVVGGNGSEPADPLHEELTEHISSQTLPKLRELWQRYEQCAAEVPGDLLPAHKEFARRDLHPLLLCSPFIHRTFTKPLGYAGDYEMVNMMFRRPWEGQTIYARIVNALLITAPTAQGHRNRIDRLTRCLDDEARRAVEAGHRLRVLNVGCGPAIEVQQFLHQSPHADDCTLELVDFNDETLAYARRVIDDAIAATGRHPELRMVHESIHGLLRQASRPGADRLRHASGEYHLVYCAGLFDYLSDRICKRLLRLFIHSVVPGGLVVATNVDPSNPMRQFMEHVLEWNLIHRSKQQMLKLAPAGSPVQAFTDATGTNVFLEVRRPKGEDPE